MPKSFDLVRPAVDAFLTAYPAPAPPFVRGLLHYLNTPTPAVHAAPCSISAVDEAEIRIALIRQLHQKLRDAYLPDQDFFSAVQISVLLLMPLDTLRRRVEEAPVAADDFRLAMYGFVLEDTRAYLRYFFQGAHPQTRYRKRKHGQGTEAIEGGPSEPGNARVSRSDVERRKCRDRDGNVCVLTGAAQPDVCHIVPFAMNSCRANLKTTQMSFVHFLRFFFPASDARQIVPTVASGLGCSDRSWNMLCISPEMHRYWAHPYWALQCVGITPVAITDGSQQQQQQQQRLTMRFYWMRAKPNDPDRKVNIDTDDDDDAGAGVRTLLAGLADAMAADADNAEGTVPGTIGIVAAHHRSNHPLVSGEEFTVVLDTLDDALCMKRMLDIQWALVTIAAMSGAAGPADDDDDDDDMSELGFQRYAFAAQADVASPASSFRDRSPVGLAYDDELSSPSPVDDEDNGETTPPPPALLRTRRLPLPVSQPRDNFDASPDHHPDDRTWLNKLRKRPTQKRTVDLAVLQQMGDAAEAGAGATEGETFPFAEQTLPSVRGKVGRTFRKALAKMKIVGTRGAAGASV